MIIDAKLLGKKSDRMILIADRPEENIELETVPPYFYIIVPRGKISLLRRVMASEEIELAPTEYKAIVMKGDRYVVDERMEVWKVVGENPRQIPEIAARFRKLGIRVSGHNIRYIVRNCFDQDVWFFGTAPAFYGVDEEIMSRLKKVRGLVLDVEVIEGKPKLVSCYWYSPFDEVRADDVISLELPKESDRLVKIIREASLLIGHNIKGFDLPILKRAGIHIDEEEKSVFDTSELLATYGSALKVGSARSLLDVATILKDDAGISEKELEIKRRVGGRVDKLSWDELVRYNVNDIILTAKILNVLFPFAAVLSAISEIPLSEVTKLPSGLISAYYLHRFMELLGYVPEYRQSGALLEGERVFALDYHQIHRNVLQCDVKMMYPTYVVKNFIDPTLHVGEKRFDRRAGLGPIYSAVKRLYEIRAFTKKLKNKDKLFEPLDAGVKALVNSLAYGVQGMRGENAIAGNPWCPERIFYGTREAQFGAIRYLQTKGYRVLYSDTDSFFVELGECRTDEECREKVALIVKELNSYLAQFGLEVDVEKPPGRKDRPWWDYMIIHSKKSYLLRAGDVIIIKGSPFHNLDKFYTPECISLAELLRRESREERLAYVEEAIERAPIEDLFVRSHQQLWRLIGVDVQRFKRLPEEKKRSYAKVLTEWEDKPTLILKKAKISHLIMPHSNPIFAPLIENNGALDPAEYSPYTIIEIRSLYISEGLEPLRARYGVNHMLVYNGSVLAVDVERYEYVIYGSGKEFVVPSGYTGKFPDRPIGILRRIRAELRVREIDIDEDVLRRCVKTMTLKKLKQFGLI